MRSLEEIRTEAEKVMNAKRTAERKIAKCRERLCQLRQEELEYYKAHDPKAGKEPVK